MDWFWTLIYASIIAFLGFKSATFLKNWIRHRKDTSQSGHENAFKGFVRDQKGFSSNFWGMVKAYRERMIKKLGWDE